MENRKYHLAEIVSNYDRVYNLGYFFDGGALTMSKRCRLLVGRVYPGTKQSVFNYNVETEEF